MAPPLVQIRGLTKLYRHGEIDVTALDKVTLDIGAGEFVALMGPSGSGKSTLLHIIAGITPPCCRPFWPPPQKQFPTS